MDNLLHHRFDPPPRHESHGHPVSMLFPGNSKMRLADPEENWVSGLGGRSIDCNHLPDLYGVPYCGEWLVACEARYCCRNRDGHDLDVQGFVVSV